MRMLDRRCMKQRIDEEQSDNQRQDVVMREHRNTGAKVCRNMDI